MKDTKHLQLRHNTWWLYYKLPKRLKDHPLFEHEKSIYTQSLKTDSLTKAKRLRDRILTNLMNSVEDDNAHEAWQKEILKRSLQFTNQNPHLNGELTYTDLLIDEIVTEAGKREGFDEYGHPKRVTELEQIKLDVIAGKKPDRSKSLKTLAKKVIAEGKARQLSPAALFKINRGSEWFLEHLLQDDIDISLIDYDQVHEFVVSDTNAGVSGSTLDGYLYGLRQVWERARQSKLVSGDNPFQKHRIKKNTESYDPFTHEEVKALYEAASDHLKPLIHAAATTGARLNELLTAEVKTPTAFGKPCWLFKFTSKGKNEQSTRAVPLHHSLQLEEGFKFTLVQSSTIKQFRKLVEKTLGSPVHELTGKPRKLSFHSFRSTVVTELVASKLISPAAVGKITGHLAGDGRLGAMNTYINVDDLNKKKSLVDLITWLE